MEPRTSRSGASVVLGLLVLGLLAPALAMTAARAFGSGTGPGVLMAAFAPYALLAYGVVLVVLMVAWLRRRARIYVGPGIVLTIVLLAIHVAWLLPLVDGPTQVDGAPDDAVTVMTSNVLFGRADPDDLIRVVREHGVDVLTLQEVDPTLLAALDDRGLGEVLPHRAGEASEGARGTVVVSRFPLGPAVDLGLSLGSVCTLVGVPGAPFTFVAAHPVRPLVRRSTGWAVDHQRLRDAVADIDGPVVVAGDLNATPDHTPYRALLDVGLVDAVDATNGGWQPTWPADGQWSWLGLPVPPLVRIDHVLVGQGVRAYDVRAVTVAGTDHRAVIAVLATRAAG